ncbi:MAG TPA: 2-dehydropantoate 2-reductase [Desulfobulbaceae bacterium]|nr:2-dehydropantoate 2-reductase [Desulfobulbaceae bacterium]
MHVVLVGPGALGSMLAVRLAPQLEKKGETLSLLDHDRQRAHRLAEEGITLYRNDNRTTIHPIITTDPTDISGCDVILLCVKSGDAAKALRQAAPLITEDTLIVGMQNGMAHLEKLRRTKGIAVAAVSSAGATLTAPGQVMDGGSGVTRFGLLSKTPSLSKHLENLVALFNRADLEAEVVPNILPRLWEKLFVNVAINALTAIHKRKNGQLLTSCSIRNTMKKVVSEAMAVARAREIEIFDDPIATAFAVCRRTRNNTSSMLQDVLKQRTTEIAAINGFIVDEGKQLGIDTPVNAELVRRVRKIEQSWQAAA